MREARRGLVWGLVLAFVPAGALPPPLLPAFPDPHLLLFRTTTTTASVSTITNNATLDNDVNNDTIINDTNDINAVNDTYNNFTNVVPTEAVSVDESEALLENVTLTEELVYTNLYDDNGTALSNGSETHPVISTLPPPTVIPLTMSQSAKSGPSLPSLLYSTARHPVVRQLDSDNLSRRFLVEPTTTEPSVEAKAIESDIPTAYSVVSSISPPSSPNLPPSQEPTSSAFFSENSTLPSSVSRPSSSSSPAFSTSGSSSPTASGIPSATDESSLKTDDKASVDSNRSKISAIKRLSLLGEVGLSRLSARLDTAVRWLNQRLRRGCLWLGRFLWTRRRCRSTLRRKLFLFHRLSVLRRMEEIEKKKEADQG